MESARFELLVAQAFESLPEWVKQKIENVALTVEDDVSQEERKAQDLASDETLFGLYVGVPATVRGDSYGIGPTLPDKIIIYRRPILEAAEGDEKQIQKLIRDTVYHEFAHHFGMNEKEVREREKRGW